MHALESLFLVAFGLYTYVIIKHHRTGLLTGNMVRLFGLALGIDLLATVTFCMFAKEGLSLSAHAVAGYAALLIMAAHFAWAFRAHTVVSVKARGRFNQYSIYAWMFWIVASLSGIPLR